MNRANKNDVRSGSACEFMAAQGSVEGIGVGEDETKYSESADKGMSGVFFLKR